MTDLFQGMDAQDNDRIGTDLLLDTGAMRIWSLRLGPGETIAPHRHDRPYFWTVTTDGEGRSRFNDGREVFVTYRSGDTGHFPNLNAETRFDHDLTNTGDTELVFVTVEFNPIEEKPS